MSNGAFPQRQSGRGGKLTTDFNLVPRLRMSETIALVSHVPSCCSHGYIYLIFKLFWWNLFVSRNISTLTVTTKLYCSMWRKVIRILFSSLYTVANRKHRLSGFARSVCPNNVLFRFRNGWRNVSFIYSYRAWVKIRMWMKDGPTLF